MSTNAPKTRVVFSVSVNTATKGVALISISIAVFLHFLALFNSPLRTVTTSLVYASIEMTVCGLLLFGLDQKRPKFYVPYFVWRIICITVAFSGFILSLNRRAYMYSISKYVGHKSPELQFMLYIFMFIFTIFAMIYLFLVIPLYSFELIKSEIKNVARQDGDVPKQVVVEWESGGKRVQNSLLVGKDGAGFGRNGVDFNRELEKTYPPYFEATHGHAKLQDHGLDSYTVHQMKLKNLSNFN